MSSEVQEETTSANTSRTDDAVRGELADKEQAGRDVSEEIKIGETDRRDLKGDAEDGVTKSNEEFTYFEEAPKAMMEYEYKNYQSTPINVLVQERSVKYNESEYEDLSSPVLAEGEDKTNKSPRVEYHKKMPNFDTEQRKAVVDVMYFVPRSLVHFEPVSKIPVREKNTFSPLRERPAATVSPNGKYVLVTGRSEEECPENKYDIFIRRIKTNKKRRGGSSVDLKYLSRLKKSKLLKKFKKLDLENTKSGIKVNKDDQVKLDRYLLLTMSEYYSRRKWKKYSNDVKEVVLYIESMNKMLELCFLNYQTYSKYASTSRYYDKLPKRIKKESNAVQQKFNVIPFTALGSYVPTEEDFNILIKSVKKEINANRRRLKFSKGKRVLFVGYQKTPVKSINLPLDDSDIEEIINNQISQKKRYKYSTFKKIFKSMKKSQYKKEPRFNLVHASSIDSYIAVLKNLWMCLVSGLFKILKYKQKVTVCIVGNVPNYTVANVLNRIVIAMLKSSKITNVSKYILFPISIGNERYGCKQHNNDHLFGHMVERWDQPIFTLNGYRILKSIWHGSRLYKYNLSMVKNYASAFNSIKYRFAKTFHNSPVIILQQSFPFGFLTRVSDCNRLYKDVKRIKSLRITVLCLKKNGGTDTVDRNELLLKENELLSSNKYKKQTRKGEKKLITIKNVNSPKDMDVINEWLNSFRIKILNNNIQMLIVPMMIIEKKSFRKNYKKLKKVLKLQEKNKK
ncbi:hypothetical protein FG386_003303 [Cryptosporidium ryanae]|uniref:uncharacterized protein n=1 Tax=Cryptosporidium ryanae TaxID=515981 RepID=UPI00351A98FB|nr:hypothetical protein FG386_003303 [Cryptosporidium ryanae]